MKELDAGAPERDASGPRGADAESLAGRASAAARPASDPGKAHHAVDAEGDPDAVIAVPAPPKPRWLDCLVLLLAFPLLNLLHLVAMIFVAAAEALLRAADLPTELALVMGVGTWILMLGILGLLLHAHQTRYRAATVEATRIIVGLLDPPRGVVIRFDQLVGFRCAGAGVVLVLRRKPWTRWLGPVVACDGALMHRVVERLEAHGVRRIDG